MWRDHEDFDTPQHRVEDLWVAWQPGKMTRYKDLIDSPSACDGSDDYGYILGIYRRRPQVDVVAHRGVPHREENEGVRG